MAAQAGWEHASLARAQKVRLGKAGVGGVSSGPVVSKLSTFLQGRFSARTAVPIQAVLDRHYHQRLLQVFDCATRKQTTKRQQVTLRVSERITW